MAHNGLGNCMYISYENEVNINKDTAISFEHSGKHYFFWSCDPCFINRFSDSLKTEFEKYDNLKTFLSNFIYDFCGAVIDNSGVRVFASLFSPSRYYLFKTETQWRLTNNPNELLELDTARAFNSYELLYFFVNGYTTAFSTFYKNWYKLLPGEVIAPAEISDNYEKRLESNLLIEKLAKNTVKKQTFEAFDCTFDKILKKVISGKKRIGVLFSGGADSAYLLLKLLSLAEDKTFVTALIFFSKKLSTINSCDDKLKAVKFLKEHNIKYEIIDPLKYETLSESLFKNISAIPFDSHASLWIGGALRSISAQYDLILTGQNADSMYNFGPTARLDLKNIILKRSFQSAGLGEYLKRRLYQTEKLNSFKRKNKSYGLIANLKFLLHLYHFDKRMLSGMRYSDFLAGFSCQCNYIPYFYSNMVKNVITNEGIDAFFSKMCEAVNGLRKYTLDARQDLLLLKLFTFVQGSDSAVMKEIGVKSNCSTVFPFTEPDAIAFFSSYKLTADDSVHPKKFIYEFHKKNNITLPKQIIKNANYMTGKQSLHLINSVIFDLLENNSERIFSLIQKFPDILNKQYFIKEFTHYLNDEDYNTDIVFRLLWLSVSFYLM